MIVPLLNGTSNRYSLKCGMRGGEIDVPENLYYSKEHQWVSVEGEKCRVGLTDYAQKQFHEVIYIDLPQVAQE
jgi:glycine cleavage system H lipoate-binding protein